MLTLASFDPRQAALVLLVVTALLLASILRAQELPLGFFDYLGGMVEQDGELVDPLALQDAEPAGEPAESEEEPLPLELEPGVLEGELP